MPARCAAGRLVTGLSAAGLDAADDRTNVPGSVRTPTSQACPSASPSARPSSERVSWRCERATGSERRVPEDRVVEVVRRWRSAGAELNVLVLAK
jgi:hypothetical protein